MSYIEDNLLPNENILFKARIHPAIFSPAIVSFIFSIIFFVIGFSNNAQMTKTGSPPPPPSFLTVIGSSLLCFSVFFLFYTVILAIQAFIILKTTEFGVTNRRIIAKTGFIKRHSLEMLLSKVESVAVRQNILGRILNFGVVTVTGTGGTKESFRAISEPVEVKKKINQIIENSNINPEKYLK